MCLILLYSVAQAFHGAIEGKVTNRRGEALAGAQVWLEGYEAGTATDTAGDYLLEVPMHGEFVVVYQFMGYKSETLSVTVHHGERVRRNITLRETSIPIPAVETRAQRQLVHQSKAPEPTAVIPKKAAEQAGKSTIGEAAELEAGVQLQKRCSACEESEVSIQGLPGRFSLILFEGLPVFSELASRYILDLLPVDFIDRLEVLKGAAGAIWGSDAVAGAVNVKLLQPIRPFEARGAYTRRSLGNDFTMLLGSATRQIGFSLIGTSNNRVLVDLNSDGFSENTAFRRSLLLATLNYHPGATWQLGAGGSYGDEDRRAGSMTVDSLAEKVHTRRWDLWQRAGLTRSSAQWELKLAASGHREDGIVEQREYLAQQATWFGEMNAAFPGIHSGISVLSHTIEDSRLFGAGHAENDLGIWAGGRNLNLNFLRLENEFLPALRLDLNSLYGTILSPYLALKLYPGWLDLSFAAGTGFRTPTIIFTSTENLPNGYRYAIRRDPNLTRESGLSLQVGAARTIVAGATAADLRLNLFHHRVTNFIAAKLIDTDTVQQRAVFYYYNLEGAALSSGAELSANLVFPHGITATANTYLLAPRNTDGQTLSFIRHWAAKYSLGYRHSSTGIELGLAGEVNGPMLVQTVAGGSTVHQYNSPVYTLLNLRAARQFGIIHLAGGINNIWNYHQPALSHEGGSAEYYWGPIVGRELYATLTITI